MSKYKTPDIKDLIEAGVHFGHQAKRWHPKMEQYIYTVSSGVHIIDLEETEKKLKVAAEKVYEIAKEGKTVVFVGTKRQSKDIIELEAKRSGALFVTERWIGGTITNFPTIKKNLDKLLRMIKGREDGSYSNYTKKERLMIDREIEKLQTVYGGIVSMKQKPDLLFVVDSKREKTAIKEAKAAGIPVVSIVDTNCDPSLINYVIPGNDDAIKSVALLVRVISDAVEAGYQEFDKKSEAVEAPIVEVKTEEIPVNVTTDESPKATKTEKKEIDPKEAKAEASIEVKEEKKPEVKKAAPKKKPAAKKTTKAKKK